MKIGKPGHPFRPSERSNWSVFGADGWLIIPGSTCVVWLFWHGGGEVGQPVYWDAASETYSVDCERGVPVSFTLEQIERETDPLLAQVRIT